MKKILLFSLFFINATIVYADGINRNAVEYIIELYNNSNKTVVTNNSINYNYATNVNLMNDRLGGTTTSLDGGNIRYYGAEPNNYIDIGDKTEVDTTKNNWELLFGSLAPFSDTDGCLAYIQDNKVTDQEIASMSNYTTASEFCSVTTIPAGTPILWRIIGVFDGKLRIRRDESIGLYSYDVSSSDINQGWGINEWSQADLMKLLNPGYENNVDKDYEENDVTVNNSLYWNSGSGKCYNGQSNATIECDFRSIGLSEEAKENVVDQTLYLGGFNTENIYANEAWTIERGNNLWNSTKPCGSGNQPYCTDTVERTLSWTGKVGLIYPSDFGYAADFSNLNCQGNLRTFINNSFTDGCTENWMSKGASITISPWANQPHIEMIVYTGLFSPSTAEFLGVPLGGWPTLTLNLNVFLQSGTGTKDDPYVIGKENKYTATINYYGEDGKLLNIKDNPHVIENLSSGYKTIIKPPKVSGCFAKDVEINITNKNEVYDVYYSCSVIVNPKTGYLLITIGSILGISSIAYLVYYIIKSKKAM